MKRRADRDVLALISEMEQAAEATPNQWYSWLDKHLQPARLEFPMGEICNREIAGYVAGWKLKGQLKPSPLLESDQFIAQGLEEKIVIETDLTAALLVYRELPEHRRQLFY